MSNESRGMGARISRAVFYIILAIVGFVLVVAVVGLVRLFFYWGILAAEAEKAALSLPEILLAAASLFILIFSVLVGLAAVFGWRSLKDLVRREVLQRVNEDFKTLSTEVRVELDELKEDMEEEVDQAVEGVESDLAVALKEYNLRTLSLDGYIKAKMALQKYGIDDIDPRIQNEIEIVEPDILDAAINTYERLLTSATENDEEEKYEKIIRVVKNNLAYLLAVRGDGKDDRRAIQLIQELRDYYPAWDDPDVLNTYARVVATYYRDFRTPMKAIVDAWECIAWVHDNASESPREDARRHAFRLDQAFRSLLR